MRRYVKRLIRRGEVGQSIIVLAIGFIGLVAVVGITTDISLMFARYNQLRRAVDSAAIAAAGQIRQDQDVVTAQLAAKQFIEFHGLDPTEVEVLTCEMLEPDQRTPELNPDVCTLDQRKLVRVTAWVEPPTIFLDLLGLRIPPLSASAISETAVLEVVVIMDVSESMLGETTYQDWGQIGLGMAYVPPRMEPPGTANTPGGTPGTLGGTVSYPQYNETVYTRMMDYTPVPNPPPPGAVTELPGDVIPVLWVDDNSSGEPDAGDRMLEDPGKPPGTWQPNNTISGFNNYVMDPTKDAYSDWRVWFFHEFHLGVSQAAVNNRLYYLPADDVTTTDRNLTDNGSLPNDIDRSVPPSQFPADPPSAFYPVRSFTPNYPGDLETELGAQDHPRPECRVRYFPYSINQELDNYGVFPAYRDEENPANNQNLLDFYTSNGIDWGYWQDGGNRFSGFVPTYKFYGCCNDPGTTNDDGDIIGTGADGNFEDLICQPFKKARDATELFLERIDFARGDRVALVTFDRSAFLIDPDGELGTDASYNAEPLIDRYDVALRSLREDVGVRAEPNFYVWNKDDGSWSHTVVDGNNGNAFLYRGPVYAQGVSRTTGQSIPAYYGFEDWDNGTNPMPVSPTVYGDSGFDTPPSALPSTYNDYPVSDNCLFFNATLQSIYTRSSQRTGTAPLQDDNFRIPAIADDASQSYILRAQCRGTNMGAALRTGANALTSPQFGARTEGSVWIMVLLSDGAAGASNPVRSQGRKLANAFPYEYGSAGSSSDLANTRGEYGAYGLCPMVAGSELIDDEWDAFPYCSDTQFYTRHFCTGGIPGTGTGADVGNTGFYPNALDQDYDPSQPIEDQLRNVYDVDIGNYPVGWSPGNASPNGCHPMYDVDDYARDWADFITGIQREDWFGPWEGGTNDAGSRDPEIQGNENSTLPTIFTIGFGLNFNNGRVGDEPGSCEENVPDCLGEELLRYIADAGDNFQIDNDYQQYLLARIATNIDGEFAEGPILFGDDPLEGRYGAPDPCQAENGWDWEDPNGTTQPVISRQATESCGNYYNAPDQEELEAVFDDIASRMFTRLSG